MSRPVIVIAQPRLARLAAVLSGHYDVLSLWEEPDPAALARASALVAAGEFAISPETLDRMPALGLIAVYSVGYDGIDVDLARSRGIAVSHAQDVNHEDVADLAIGLILAQRRGIVAGDRAVRDGRWTERTNLFLPSCGGAAIGIVGLGGIGDAVARRAEAMRMRVAWWGPNPKPQARWPRAESLMALAKASDILVVAAKAGPDNRGLVSADVIAALGPDGLLVNVARGQLVDEEALIAALRDGRLGGAALDVFAEEPTPAARWAEVPNVVLTPHIAGATGAAVAEMLRQLIANLAAFHAGEPLLTPVA